MKRYQQVLSLLLLFILQINASSADKDIFTTQVIASDLGVPWGMSLLPNNSMLISQRDARLNLLSLDTNEIVEISGLPEIMVGGQGGFFDVAVSPDYKKTGWIYFTYNKEVKDQGTTTISRARLSDNKLTDWQDLLVTQARTSKKVHFGGRITFDHQGHVFFSIGDRGTRSNAQDLKNHAGTILRLNMDGSIPKDNPFVNDNNVLDEIWSYGHRNPQGLFFNTQTQQLWGIEHGPRGGDEINLIEAGKNYGWPVISYGKEYWGPISVGKGEKREGMEQPVKYYIPSIAPSSLIQYSGTAFPQWQGKLFAGALALQHLNQVTINDDNQASAEERLLDSLGRIRNVIESPEGWLYISTDNGRIIRIRPTVQ